MNSTGYVLIINTDEGFQSSMIYEDRLSAHEAFKKLIVNQLGRVIKQYNFADYIGFFARENGYDIKSPRDIFEQKLTDDFIAFLRSLKCGGININTDFSKDTNTSDVWFKNYFRCEKYPDSCLYVEIILYESLIIREAR